MHVVVDIGSTDTKLGLFAPEDRRPVAVERLSTMEATENPSLRTAVERLRGSEKGGAVDRVVLGSVSPRHTDAVRQALAAALPGAAVLELSGFERLPFRPGPEGLPVGVGADRIANGLGALVLFDTDVILVDAGTATTVDCVTVDGVFVGGAIAPGLGTGLAWLLERAPHLPGVPLEPPARAIGRRSEDALQSGAFHVALGGVERLVRRVRDEWARPNVEVVVTGGYAPLLAARMADVDRVEPHLTLVGLEVAGESLRD